MSDKVTETFLKAAREDAQPARFSTPAEEVPMCLECNLAPQKVSGFCGYCYLAREL
jgi:hypothetical protein